MLTFARAAALASIVVAAGATAALAEVAPLDCTPGSVCRDPATSLPARVLTRAFANVYKSEDDSPGNILAENIKAFSPLYIFERKDADDSDPANPQGWYYVGESASGAPLGWMHARDVVEWRQAIIVAFTHPGIGEEARRPVLMFDDAEALRTVVEADDPMTASQTVYGQVDQALAGSGAVPEGVVSMEPKAFIDIREQFYMLPVLQFEEVDRGDEEARYLQVVAVTQDRAVPGTSSTLQDEAFREDVVSSGTLMDAGAAAELGIDIVFVMDLTSSMGPFIEQTRLAMTDLVRLITQEGQADKLKFGLVGYRDDVATLPNVEFTAKNFTPDLLSADDFLGALETVTNTEQSSGDYQEDVFAGIQEALQTTKWSEPSLRFFVLVGDASAHPVGHPQSTTNLDEQTLRQQLNIDKVNLLAMHLLEARAATEDHPLARQQFTTLATNPGVADAAYVGIDVQDTASFQAAVKAIGETFTQLLSLLQAGDVEAIAATADEATGGTMMDDTGGESSEPGLEEPADDGVLMDDVGGTDDSMGTETIDDSMSGESSAPGGDTGEEMMSTDDTMMTDDMMATDDSMAGESSAPGGDTGEEMMSTDDTMMTDDMMATDDSMAGESSTPGGDTGEEMMADDTMMPADDTMSTDDAFDAAGDALSTDDVASGEEEAASGEETGAVEETRAAAEALGYAALVPYLGKAAQPPRDVTAWVFDHDLEQPDIPSLEVRVLLTRQQVNDLVYAVERVLQAIKRAELTQMKFFEALSGIAVETSKGEKIDYENAQRLGDTGLLESWVASLPYKSQVLSMNNEFYAALQAQEKSNLELSLEAKLEGYQTLINSDKWIALNERDAPEDYVYPLELGALP